MSELSILVEESPAGGSMARALGESIFTAADDLDSLRERVRETVRCHFAEREGPRVSRCRFSR